MTKKILFVLVLLAALGTQCPRQVFASDKVILLDSQALQTGWQIVAEDGRTTFEKVEDGYLLKNFDATTLVYNARFGYKDYDRLIISLKSSDALDMRIIPNVTTTASYTFENEQTVAVSDDVQTTVFSLHYPNFHNVENFGIKFSTRHPTDIMLLEISLAKSSWPEALLQPFKDYIRVAPYSAYTVNLFATPRIFGRSAFLYFLPVLLLLMCGFLFSRKLGKASLLGFAILWLVTDMRMSYEFLSYQAVDYREWTKPPLAEKTFRTYDDFYAFVWWLKKNLSQETQVNFFTRERAHLPRIMQYYLYPILVTTDSTDAQVYIIYHEPKIMYNDQDQRLYLEGRPISAEGRIMAYDENSFIFVSK